MGKRVVQVGFGFLCLISVLNLALVLIWAFFGNYPAFCQSVSSALSIARRVIIALMAIGFGLRFFETWNWAVALQMIGCLALCALNWISVPSLVVNLVLLLFIVFLAIPHFIGNVWLAGLLILVTVPGIILSIFPGLSQPIWENYILERVFVSILSLLGVLREALSLAAVSIETE